MHTHNAFLTNLPKKRTKNQEASAQTLKLNLQTTNFLKENILWENLSCLVDCMFGNPAEKKLHQKSEKLLAWKNLENKNLLGPFLPQKIPLDT